MKRSPLTFALAAVMLCGLAGWALQSATRAAQARAAAPGSLAGLLPQGALLSIEASDFAAVLHTWTASPEQRAWLLSENHSVFANSRLFGRLTDAQHEFESAAQVSKSAQTSKAAQTTGDTPDGPSFDASFLTQIAGRQSIFAWYDIGNLEFVYITRLAPGQAAQIALLNSRPGFTPRQAGGATFYIRRSPQSQEGRARTVGFAQLNSAGQNLLILATREDLIASTLELIAHPGSNSLAQEPWFADVTSTLSPEPSPPALHMMLNLNRVARTPYFRSYWVQRNVSQMSQYRAAVADLYFEPSRFREERSLLPESSESPDNTAKPDLSALAALAPRNGVFNATATSDSAQAVAAIEERLLGHIEPVKTIQESAPNPELDAPAPGSTGDLESFIDTPAPVTTAIANDALARAIGAGSLDAMLTFSTATYPQESPDGWVSIHSAVALHTAASWNSTTLKSALQESLRGQLTASTLGIQFTASKLGSQTIYALDGPRPLFFSIAEDQHLCIFADDERLLRSLLGTHERPSAAPSALLRIAGFDNASQRAPFTKLTGLIDGTRHAVDAGSPGQSDQSGTVPAYFSRNLRSLSDSFSSLASERIVERREGSAIRQTVTYQWQPR